MNAATLCCRHPTPEFVNADLTISSIDDLDASCLVPLVEESEQEGFRFLRRLIAEPAAIATVDARRLGVWRGTALLAVGGITPDPYLLSPRIGRLRHLYVRPAERSRGIGAVLVAALETFGYGRFDLIRLRTDTEPAARFYERLGYEPLAPGGTATHQRRL